VRFRLSWHKKQSPHPGQGCTLCRSFWAWVAPLGRNPCLRVHPLTEAMAQFAPISYGDLDAATAGSLFAGALRLNSCRARALHTSCATPSLCPVAQRETTVGGDVAHLKALSWKINHGIVPAIWSCAGGTGSSTVCVQQTMALAILPGTLWRDQPLASGVTSSELDSLVLVWLRSTFTAACLPHVRTTTFTTRKQSGGCLGVSVAAGAQSLSDSDLRMSSACASTLSP
jgi:hypothetical protein